jgi:hypothetical protein
MWHITLVIAALAVCAVTAAAARAAAEPPPTPTDAEQSPSADPGLIPLTVVEIKRLFNMLTRTRQDTAHHLHWS